MSTCAVFATSNRPGILSQVIGVLDRQTIRPTSIIVSCVSEDDVDEELRNSRRDLIVVAGERGLTKQRNRALRHVPIDAKVVAFFDDDFVAHPQWIQAVEATLTANPDIAAVTGKVLADGINGSGYSFEQAWDFIVNCDASPAEVINEPYSPYGCNMAFRRAALADIWFDERLVLYGWQEDRDFGAQVARRGRIVQSTLARGVHMGVKSGRVSGIRLGYSQIANPIYLNRKGTMRLGAVCEHIARNFVSNAVRSLKPEPYIDRRGRLKGNFIAVRDLFCGRMSPEHAALL